MTAFHSYCLEGPDTVATEKLQTLPWFLRPDQRNPQSLVWFGMFSFVLLLVSSEM